MQSGKSWTEGNGRGTFRRPTTTDGDGNGGGLSGPRRASSTDPHDFLGIHPVQGRRASALAYQPSGQSALHNASAGQLVLEGADGGGEGSSQGGAAGGGGGSRGSGSSGRFMTILKG